MPGTCTDYVVVHYSSRCCCLFYHVLQASTLGMVPPRYAWITYGLTIQEEFWRQSPNNRTSYQVFDHCSSEHVINLVNEMILIHVDPRYDERDKGNPIIGNLVRSIAYSNTKAYISLHFVRYHNPYLERHVLCNIIRMCT